MNALVSDSSSAADDAVVALMGDVGPAEVERAGAHLRRVARRARDRVVLDLRRVRSIDVTGLDVLIDTAWELKQWGIAVSVTPAWADDVMRLTGGIWATDPALAH